MKTAISDNQAEAEIVATLIYHPEYLLSTESLKAGYFYNIEMGCMYWAIQELVKNGISNIDAVNLTRMLNSNNAVKKTINEYNISDIQEFIDESRYGARDTLEEYKMIVNTVIEMAYKRELSSTVAQIQKYCFDNKVNLTELSGIVDKKINGLSQKYLITEDIQMFGDKVDELWAEIKNRSEDSSSLIKSKFPALGKYFNYELGEFVLLKARMKRGKSAFFMNEFIHKVQMGVPSLYIDTEMNSRLFMVRMLANISGVEVAKINSGKYSYEEEQRLAKAMEWIKSKQFVHMYLPTSTNEEIYAIHKMLKYKMNLQFSVYDYIKSDAISTSDNYNILGGRCDFLKNNVAGDLNIAMLGGAQLNRQNMVADSDKLERYVSVSMHWRNKTEEELARDGLECGNFALTVDLNRLGEQMAESEYIDFQFDGNLMRINQAKKHKDTPFE